MKTRIFTSIILAATVAASAAQAAGLSIEETYSGALPAIVANDHGLGSYFVASKQQPGCTQHDLNPLVNVYPEQRTSVSNYLAPQSAQTVCVRS